jgi:signal transduction histidine kinase
MNRRLLNTIVALTLLWLILAGLLIAARVALGAAWVRVQPTERSDAFRVRHALASRLIAEDDLLRMDSGAFVIDGAGGSKPAQVEARPLTASIFIALIERHWGVWLFMIVYGAVGIVTYALQPGLAATRAFAWSAFFVMLTNVIDLLGPDALDVARGHAVWIDALRTITALATYTGILLFAINIGQIRQPARLQPLLAHLTIIGAGVVIGLITVQNTAHPSARRALDLMWNSIGTLTLPLGILIALIRRSRLDDADGRQQLKIVILGSAFVAVVNVGLTRVPALLQQPPLIPANLGVALDAIFPVGMALAIIRHRLFGIDIAVARALSYTLVTSSIALIYVVLIAGTTWLYGSSGRLISAIAAGVIIALVYTPLRAALEAVTSRIVYGTRGDPNKNIVAMSRLLSAKQSPEYILTELVETIPQMFAVGGAKIVSTRGDLSFKSAAGIDAHGGIQSIPLLYRGDTVGMLTTSETQKLRSHERQALEAVAQQAALVLVNAELEHSQRHHARELSLARKQELLLLRRQLHDDVLPMLDSVRHTIEIASQHLNDDNAPTIARLLDAESNLNLAQQSVRDMAYRIWPPALEVLGLSSAIGHLISSCATRHPKLTFEASVPELGRLHSAVEFVAYRMVEQCLTNAIQHAGARSVGVRCARGGGVLEIDVIDDGRGVHGAIDGVGLQNLKAMALELGGAFSLTNNPSTSGTCARLRAPDLDPPGEIRPSSGTI